MENKTNKNVSMIECLPNEIITTILRNNNCREILNFGVTCKRFNKIVNTDQHLWKNVFKRKLPSDIFTNIEQHGDGDWLHAIKDFYLIKQEIYSELLLMSPRFYWQKNDVSLEDVKSFFTIASFNKFAYYHTIYILQELIMQINENLDKFKGNKTFTLTEMYYARIVLRFLIHTYLAVNWVKAHLSNELQPEKVLNFFLQWVDTVQWHPDQDIEEYIDILVSKVKMILGNSCTPNSISTNTQVKFTKEITERQILNAVSQVIYHIQKPAINAGPIITVDTLDVNMMVKNNSADVILVGVIYQAVTRKLGVKCDLIAFPNHLFLEWRDNSDPVHPQAYTIDLYTGALQKKRRCPYAHNGREGKYHPDSLLQYLFSSFNKASMDTVNEELRDWRKQNALYLLDFLGTSYNEQNPYRYFLPYLLEHTHLPAMRTPLDLKYLSDVHMDIIRSMSNLPTKTITSYRAITVKRHDSCVKYAVGMLCYHKKYEYVCMIREWDTSCAPHWRARMQSEPLRCGLAQPFYTVLAADQSERYVAQENLTEVLRPVRIKHMEDIVAWEFTHFNGFAYIPNDQKKSEYPDEIPISYMFRNHAELKA